jgi:hypothetical protein
VTEVTTSINRAQFLRRSATGGLALVGGGTVLAMAEGVAFAQAPSQSDVDTAKAAYTAESLAVFGYTAAIRSGKFKGPSLKYLRAALKDEKAHREALADLLGSATPTGLKFRIPSKHTRSAGTMVNLFLGLETAFVAAYLGAVKTFESNDLKGIAAAIAANEASHQSFFRTAKGFSANIAAVPKSDTIPNTVKKLEPFIVS